MTEIDKEKLIKERLDVLLTKRAFFDSREKAQAAIMAGLVYINGNKADKPGTKYDFDTEVEVRQSHIPFVSRGGFKLQRAVDIFGLELDGAVAMDVGASTGGFTDCMLQHGAVKVYSVDVGYGQLDWKLRNDERVVCMERTNIRYVTDQEVAEKLDFVSVDVSFISLSKVLPAIVKLMRQGARIVCLIKPQFEAGREKVGKNGVVRDKDVHIDVIEKVLSVLPDNGLQIDGLTFSPIKGPKGNIEYLFLATCVTDIGHAADKDDVAELDAEMVKKVVTEAHDTL